MKVIIDLFSSKKFLVLLGAVITSLGSGMSGVITWADALKGILAAVIAYLAAQGYADGASGGMTSSQPGTPSASDLPKNG